MVLYRDVFGSFQFALPVYGVGFVAANLAQPCEKQGFAAVTAHFANNDTHRSLHDLFCKFGIIVHARQNKSKQAWKIFVKKCIKSVLVAGSYAAGQRLIQDDLGGFLIHCLLIKI